MIFFPLTRYPHYSWKRAGFLKQKQLNWWTLSLTLLLMSSNQTLNFPFSTVNMCYITFFLLLTTVFTWDIEERRIIPIYEYFHIKQSDKDYSLLLIPLQSHLKHFHLFSWPKPHLVLSCHSTCMLVASIIRIL